MKKREPLLLDVKYVWQAVFSSNSLGFHSIHSSRKTVSEGCSSNGVNDSSICLNSALSLVDLIICGLSQET